MDSIEVSDAIAIVLGRMETNPSEFFNEAYRWRFIFKELFLDALTDPEKIALNEGMVRVRRAEFCSTVLRAVLDEPLETGTISTIAGTVSGTVASQYNPTIQNQRTMLTNAGMGVAQQYNAAQQAVHSPLQNAMAGQGQNLYGLANSNGIK